MNGHNRARRLRKRGRQSTFRTFRLALWLTLLGGPVLLQSTDVRSQIEAPDPTSDSESEANEAPAPERADAVEADEPAEVTASRLLALPVSAQARLMAVQQAVAQRIAEGASGIYVGEIHEEIEIGIAYYTERVVNEAERANAALLVWEIETPGGRVDAAVMMRDYMLDSAVPSVAFVNRRAWSAGALISLANDLIVVVGGSSIGAATPIQMGGGQAQPVSEKIVSALRGEFRSTAEATGRSAEIAESMVDADLAVGGIIPSGRLLTLTGKEALEAGIAEAEVNDFNELLELLNVEEQPVTMVSESWAESLVRVLTSSTVAGLLMTLGLLGIFFELTSPGFGWAGAMGISALVLFFAGHLLVNLAGMEELLIFIVGIALLAVEIFLIPGFGITGALGLVAIGTSLTLALIAMDIDISFSPIGWTGALVRVVVSLSATVVGAIAIFKLVPRTSLGRRLVLSEALAAGPAIDDSPHERISLGDTGVALSDLRPYGKARFDGRRVEVVAEGGYITKGDPLRVVRVAGHRVEVRAIGGSSDAEE